MLYFGGAVISSAHEQRRHTKQNSFCVHNIHLTIEQFIADL